MNEKLIKTNHDLQINQTFDFKCIFSDENKNNPALRDALFTIKSDKEILLLYFKIGAKLHKRIKKN